MKAKTGNLNTAVKKSDLLYLLQHAQRIGSANGPIAGSPTRGGYAGPRQIAPPVVPSFQPELHSNPTIGNVPWAPPPVDTRPNVDVTDALQHIIDATSRGRLRAGAGNQADTTGSIAAPAKPKTLYDQLLAQATQSVDLTNHDKLSALRRALADVVSQVNAGKSEVASNRDKSVKHVQAMYDTLGKYLKQEGAQGAHSYSVAKTATKNSARAQARDIAATGKKAASDVGGELKRLGINGGVDTSGLSADNAFAQQMAASDASSQLGTLTAGKAAYQGTQGEIRSDSAASGTQAQSNITAQAAQAINQLIQQGNSSQADLKGQISDILANRGPTIQQQVRAMLTQHADTVAKDRQTDIDNTVKIGNYNIALNKDQRAADAAKRSGLSYGHGVTGASQFINDNAKDPNVRNALNTVIGYVNANTNPDIYSQANPRDMPKALAAAYKSLVQLNPNYATKANQQLLAQALRTYYGLG